MAMDAYNGMDVNESLAARHAYLHRPLGVDVNLPRCGKSLWGADKTIVSKIQKGLFAHAAKVLPTIGTQTP